MKTHDDDSSFTSQDAGDTTSEAPRMNELIKTLNIDELDLQIIGYCKVIERDRVKVAAAQKPLGEMPEYKIVQRDNDRYLALALSLKMAKEWCFANGVSWKDRFAEKIAPKVKIGLERCDKLVSYLGDGVEHFSERIEEDRAQNGAAAAKYREKIKTAGMTNASHTTEPAQGAPGDVSAGQTEIPVDEVKRRNDALDRDTPAPGASQSAKLATRPGLDGKDHPSTKPSRGGTAKADSSEPHPGAVRWNSAAFGTHTAGIVGDGGRNGSRRNGRNHSGIPARPD